MLSDIVFLLPRLGFIAVFTVRMIKVQLLKKTGLQVYATVVEVQETVRYSKEGYKVTSYMPVLQYRIDNNYYTQKANVAHPKPRYFVGQRVGFFAIHLHLMKLLLKEQNL